MKPKLGRFTLIELLAVPGVARLVLRSSTNEAGRAKRSTAFTLIELLVVVAIIAILAAMLLPVLTRAKQHAYGAVCNNNEKQLGLGLFMYGDEHNDALPASYEAKDAGGTPPAPARGDYAYFAHNNPYDGYGAMCWASYIYAYTGQSLMLFQCPAYANPLNTPGWHDPLGPSRLPQRVQSTVDPNIYGLIFSKYKLNPYVGFVDCFGFGVGPGAAWDGEAPPAVVAPIGRPVLTRVTKPAETVMLFDTWDAWFAYCVTPACSVALGGGFSGGDRSEPLNYTQPFWMAHIGKWHNNKCDVLFFDGHAQFEGPNSEYLWNDVTDSHWRITY